MAKVKYIGPSPAVSIVVDEGPDLVCVNGRVIDVDSELAEQLIAQGTFETISREKPRKKDE